MEAFLVILSFVLISGGVIFSVIPPLPGPFLSYGGLISAHFISNETQFSTASLVIWAVLAIAIVAADYALPIAATKKFGGTKAGIVGGMIGTIVGLFLPIPFGVILGPLLGAIIGDLYGGNHFRSALKSGFGSFLGFILATTIKVIFSLVLGIVVIWEVGEFTFSAVFSWF